MNKALQEAEIALNAYLQQHPDGAKMKDILKNFRGNIAEPELRAAVWTLKSQGEVEIIEDKLRLRTLAPA